MVVSAVVIAGMDSIFTIFREAGGDTLLLWKAGISIMGFDGVACLLCGGLASAILAGLFPGYSSNPRSLVRRLALYAKPEDPGKGLSNGLALASWCCAAGCFLVIMVRFGRGMLDGIRTPGYAAVAVALTALVLGAVILVLRSTLLEAARDRLSGPDGPGPLMKWVSPLTVAATGLVAVVLVLLFLSGEMIAIARTVEPGPYVILLAGCLSFAGVVLLRPVATWSRLVTVAVGLLLPSLLVLSFLLGLTVFGSDNTIRIILTSHGRLSPLAYRMIKSSLDFDGDGQLSLMNEGDCAPFDSARHGSALEVPNNGIDEDCDGSDLEMKFTAPSKGGRWDFEVPAQLADPLHVVLISIDAVSPARMSLYGYDRKTTAYLDRLAGESVWFTQAYSQGPSTRLSFPALFTSRYDSQIKRRTGTRIPLEILPSNVLLAEVMKRAGYHSLAVLPTSYFKRWKGIRQGFDRVITEPVARYRRPRWHNASAVTNAALDALEGNEQERVFLWVHYYDPHSPYTKPPGGPDFGNSKSQIYDAELAYTDREVKRLVKGLGTILPPGNTLLIIVGDHGVAFDAAHPRKHYGHDLHSSVLHVPLLVHAPFLVPRKVDAPVGVIDILPTLVNLLGIEGEYRFEGTSLVPVLLGRESGRERVLFHQFYLPENVHHRKRTLRHAGIRSRNLYLIQDLEHNTQFLYRYREDPYESVNLAEKMPEAVDILKRELKEWMARVAR